MKKTVCSRMKRTAAKAAAAVCLLVCMAQPLLAEEASGYYDEAGNWIADFQAADGGGEYGGYEETPDVGDLSMAEDMGQAAAPLTGTWSAVAGWSVDDSVSTDGKTVYKRDTEVGMDGVSEISCSYIDTNYSVLEYEQLRDMLTNNLLYSNVNAQISTSAAYTQEKDYLYIVIVDDSAQDYREIYHYVVGDYRCFCVEVREYRAEAGQAAAAGQTTPQEAGQTMAETFTWSEG